MRALTVGSLPPEWGGRRRGGVATFHASLLHGLLERRADVEVVGVLPPNPPDRAVPVPVFARPEGIGRADFYEQLLERLRPDVVLMNHIAHTVGVTHAELGSPVPAVGVVHSWHSVTFSSGEERQRAIEVTETALSALDAVVAPSRHTLAEGRRLGFSYPPIAEAIHNPVPPHLDASELDIGRRRHGVLYLGSLIPRKAPDALVRAASLVPDLAVDLVGSGRLEPTLRTLIDNLALADRVRILRPAPGDDHLRAVSELLLGAEVMCLPSSSEGLPLAFVEALSCGTPIVGFGAALREIGDELGIAVGVPLDGNAPEEIATALAQVLAACWDRAELRRATLRAFRLSRVVDRYLDLLTRVAASSRVHR